MPIITPPSVESCFEELVSRKGRITSGEIAELFRSGVGADLVAYIKSLKDELADLERYDDYFLNSCDAVYDGWPVTRKENEDHEGAIIVWRTMGSGPSEDNRTVKVFGEGHYLYKKDKYLGKHDLHGKFLVLMQSYGRIGYASDEIESLKESCSLVSDKWDYGVPSDRKPYGERWLDVPGTWYHWSYYCDTLEEAEQAARAFIPTRRVPNGSVLHHWVY